MICKLCGSEMDNITHTEVTPINRVDFGCTNGHMVWITIDRKGVPLSEVWRVWRDEHGNEVSPPAIVFPPLTEDDTRDMPAQE